MDCDRCGIELKFYEKEMKRCLPCEMAGNGRRAMTSNGKEPEVMEGEIVEAIVPRVPSDLQVARAPEVVLKEAHEAAKALADVIETKAKKVVLNGKTYLTFEDWQTVARFYGISVGVDSTKYIEYGNEGVVGFESRAYALITATGVHISSAEGMCLNDEANWKGKPLFQLRSMAQTRACAKALRNVLAFVPVLAGYEATPAEEMTQMGSVEAAQAVAAHKISKQMAEVEAFINKNKSPAHPKMNLPAVNQPSTIEKVLKESIKKAEERDAYAVSGMLLRAERKQGPKAKYMSVTVEQPGKKQVKLSLHPHTYQDEQKTELFNLLEMASGRFVSFLVKPETNPKFNPWVVRVLKIATLEFGQDGEPVRMKKEPERLTPLIQQEDIEEYTL